MKNSVIFIVLLFFVMVLFSDAEIVPSDVIEDIALRNAQALWGEVTQGETTPYYYTDGELVAYRFNFIKGADFPAKADILNAISEQKTNSNVPYPFEEDQFCMMLVSARRDMPVILEHSETLSHEYLLGANLQSMSEKELGKGFTLERSYYLTTANVWYCVSRDGRKKYIRLLPPAKVLEEEEFFEFAATFNFFCEQADFSEEWSNFGSGARELTRTQVFLENHEYMPFYPWHYGCGPTAASMLLGWFDYNSINTYENYSNLVDLHYTEWDDVSDSLHWHHYDYHNPNTIYELAEAMNTNSSGGTYCANMVSGTIDVTDGINDYDFVGASYFDDVTTTWCFNYIRDFVDDGLPIMIWINENHFVTAMGYCEADNTIGVHDPNHSTVDWYSKSIIDGVFAIWPDGGYGNAFNLQYPHGDLRRNQNGVGDSGEIYEGNDICEIHWETDSDNPYDHTVTIILDRDSENHELNLLVESIPNTGYYWWQVPNNIDSEICRIWIELYDDDGTLVGADGSYGDFEIHPGGSFEELTYDDRVTTTSDPDFFWFDHNEENWGVVGVRSNEVYDNWGLALFNDTDFSQVIKGSQHYTGNVNLIAIDGNHAPSPERALRVAAYDNEETIYLAKVEMEGDPDENLTQGMNPLEFWPAFDVCEIWDAYLTPGVYTITLDVVSGDADLDLGIFGSTPGNYYKNTSEMLTSSTSHGAGQDESITVTITQADYYGVCVWSLNESSAEFQIDISYPGEWSGDGSTTSWYNPDNWANGIVPDAETDIHIPAGCPHYPQITSYAECHDIEISEGAEIDLSGGTFYIHGNANIDGDFDILDSDANLKFYGNVHWLEHADLQVQYNANILCKQDWIADEGAVINLDAGNIYFSGSVSSNLEINSVAHVFNNMFIIKSSGAALVFSEDSNQELEILEDLSVQSPAEFHVETEAPVKLHDDFIASAATVIFEVGQLYFVGEACNIWNSEDSEFCEILVASGANLYLNDSCTIKLHTMIIDGTVFAYNSNIEVSGGWFSEEGLFSGTLSTVIFNGEGNQYVDETDFNNVVVDKDYGGELIVYVDNDFVCESLEFDSGTVRVNGGSFTALDLADVRVMGNYILDSGTINLYQGTSDYEYIDLDANIWIYNGTFNIHGGYDYPSEWAYTRGITVHIEGGVLDFKDNGILISDTGHELNDVITGGIIRTSGDFKVDDNGFYPAGSNQIELYGGGTAYCYNNPGSSFRNVRVNKGSDTRENEERDRLNRVIFNYDTTIDQDLLVESGFVQINDISLTIGDDLLFYGGLNMNSEDDRIYVADDVTWYNGSGATVYNGEFHVGGNWMFYNGINCEFESGNIVYFDGTTSSTISSYSTSACFGDVKIDKETGSTEVHSYNNNTVQIAGDLEVLSDNVFDLRGNDMSVDGMIDLYSGSTFNVDNGGVLNVSNLVMQGDMNVYGGTVTVIDNFYQYSSSHLQLLGGDFIIDMPYEGSHESITGYLFMNGGNMQVTNNGIQFGENASFTQNQGELKIGWGILALYPDTFHQNGGMVEFIGSRNSQINLADDNFFNNVVINKSDATGQCYMQTEVEVNGDLSILDGYISTGDNDLDIDGSVYIGEEGKLSGGDNSIKVGGDWTNECGSAGFEEATSTVWFQGDMPVVINDDETFYDLEVFKQTGNNYYLEVAEGRSIHILRDLLIYDGTMMLHTDCSLDIDRDITIGDGAGLNCYFLDENITINLGDNFIDNNSEIGFMTSFNQGQSLFIFDGDTSQAVQTDREYFDFYNVIIDNDGGYLAVHSNLQVLGDLEIVSGRWHNGTTGMVHYLCGNVAICEDGWWDNMSTVIFYSPLEASFERFGPGVEFHNVIIDKDPAWGRNETREPAVLTLASDLIMLWGGNLTIESGTLISEGNTISCSGNVTINGGTLYLEPDAKLRVGNECALNVNAGGSLICNGTEQYPVYISCYQTGHYHEVNINTDGLISAEYTFFQYLEENGVYVTMNGTVDEDHAFNNCTFQNGIENGNLLRIRNDQELICYDAVFPENTWGSSYNVYRNRNAGEIEFINASGDFAGESFDYDPYNRIDWTSIIPPEIEVYADDPMEFGEVIIGEYSSLGIDIENTGTMELTGTITTPEGYNVSFWSRDDEQGRITNRNALSFAVAGGEIHTWRVDFEPDEVMNYDGQITIEHNADSETVIIDVTGEGIPVPPPACETSTDPLHFGDVFVGEIDSTWVSIYNSGGSALIGTMTTPDGYSIEEILWRDPEGSGLAQQHEIIMRNELEFEILAGWMMEYKLTFAPTEMQEYNGTLVIEHNAPEGETLIPVFGRGVESILSYNPYVMTTVLTPDTSEDFTLSLSNEGNLDIDYLAVVEYEGVNNIIIDEGFENDFPPAGWTTYTSGWDNWYQSDWEPHDGDYCAAGIGMEEEIHLTTPWFTATEDCVLRYWLRGYSDYWEEWMTGQFSVELSTDGTNWTVLSTMSQEDLPDEWTFYGTALCDYAGQNVVVSFNLTDNSMGRGAMLDDVLITGEADPAYSWLMLNGEPAITGTIAGGDPYEEINVSFNSAGLTEDDFYASILLLNNSRNNPQAEILAALNVGIYDMTITPASLDFGELEAGETFIQAFTIENTGSLELSGEITVPEGFTISEPIPGARENSLVYLLFPGNSFTYEITFAPETFGDFSGDAVIDNIWTDDIELLPITATGLAPGFNSNEDFLQHEEQPGGSGSDILTLSNEGNLSLEYSAEINYMPIFRDVLVSSGFENEFPPAGWTDENLGMGSSWWQDMMYPHTGMFAASADPYMVVDARLITPQFTATPDCQLSYYIRTYNQPSGGGSFGVEVSLDGNNWSFIEQIDMTTLSLDYELRTLSLADYSGSNIYVAFRMYDNTNYNCAGLLIDDVVISGNPVALDEWLSLNGEESLVGSIDPGGSFDIEVGYDAADLPEGWYSAEIEFSCNDPLNPQTSIMAELTVGYPHISVYPDTLNYWETLVGEELWQSFFIENMGDLSLTGEMNVPDGFTVLEDTLNWVREELPDQARNTMFEFSIDPWMYQNYYLIFAPDTSGNYDSELVISHNAPEASVTINIGAQAVGLPQVTTSEITEITNYSATGGGNVVSDGNHTLNSRGICWNETGQPSIEMDMFTEDGNELGEFISSMEFLMPGTTYYVRAYATNYYGCAYGEEITFNTSGPQMTLSVDELPDFGEVGMGACSMELSYTVSGTDLEDDIMIFAPMGFQVAINDARDLIFSDIINIEQVDGEIPETTIFVRFCPDAMMYYDDFITHYTMNSQGRYVHVSGTGVMPPVMNISVATLPDFGEWEAGTASTAEMYSISGFDLLGEIVITAPAGFEISLLPERVSQNRTGLSRDERVYTSELILEPENGILEETFIYARFVPQQSGSYLGEIMHQPLYGYPGFVQVSGTCISQPVVETAWISDISYTTATGGGNVISDGGLDVTARGICWSSEPDPTLDDAFTIDGTGTGSYISILTNLTENTNYYLRAYATNDLGTSYGNVVLFTTLALPVIELPDNFTFSEDGSLTVDFDQYVNDPDSYELNLACSGNLNVNIEISALMVTFTSAADWFGTENITFIVSDDRSRATAEDNVDIIVTPINDAPTIELPESFTFAEDDVLEVDFGEFVDDVDNIDLVLSVTGEEYISINITDLAVSFSAPENWFGSEILTFTVDDQQSRAFASDDVEIIVSSVNDVPIADAGGPYTGEADAGGYCEIILNGTGSYDIDGEIVEWLWSWESGSANGEEVLAEFPAGTTEVTLTVTDNESGSGTDTAQIIIGSYDNLPPVAVTDEFTLNEDSLLAENVLANDYDPDAYPQSLTAEPVSGVSNGALDFAEDGDFTYLPALNWYGTDSFSYRVYDGADYSEPVTVTLTVTPVNDAPTIELPESFTFVEDGVLEVDFVDFVDDVDNVDLVLTVSGYNQISADITDMMVTFTAAENWNGSETIIFTVDDQQGRAFASDEVEIIVTSVNDAPVANAGEEYTGQAVVTGFCEILLNGSGSYDIDGEIVAWLWTWEDGSASGEEVLALFPVGITELTLTVTDNEDAWAEDFTVVTVTGYIDLQPVAVDDEFVMNEDNLLIDNVLINDFDPDEYPQPITAELVSDVANGVLNLAADGSFTYQPAADWYGSDNFTYRAYDGIYFSNWAYVTITVIPVNDAPTIDLPESFTFVEDGVLEVDFVNFVDDVDNVDLVLTVTGEEQVIANITDMMVTFTASENWFGSEILTFTVDDQQGRAIASDDVEIIVSSVNDVPIADAGGPYTGEADAGGYCEIILNGTGSYDIDGEIVEWLWSWEGGSADGEEVLAEFQAGTTEVTMTVTDNEGGNDTDTAQVIISSYDNLPPVAVADEYSLNEDMELTDNVLANDYDPDEYPQSLIAELISGVSNGTLDFAENGDFSYLPELNWYGTDSFSYRVYDGAAYSEVVTVTLVVNPVNDAPEITAYIPEELDIFVTIESSASTANVAFALTVEDVDNETLTYNWYVNDNLESSSSLNAFDYDFGVGNFIVTGEVTDSEFFDSMTWNLFVYSSMGELEDAEIAVNNIILDPEDPEPAIVSSTPLALAWNVTSYNFTLSFDNNVIAYDDYYIEGTLSENATISITDNGDNIVIEATSTSVLEGGGALIEFYFSPVTAGVSSLEITDFNYNDTFIMNITNGSVTVGNYPPELILPLDDYNKLEDFIDFQIDLSNHFADPDDDMLDYSLEYENSEIDISINGEILTISSISNWYGTAEFTVIASDIHGAFCSDNAVVHISPVNDAPTIFLPVMFTFEEGGLLEVDFANYVEDVDNVDLVLTVTGEDHINAGIDSLIVTFSSEAGWSGSEILTFTIDDNQTRLTDSDDIEIIVTPFNGITVSKNLISGWNWFSLNVTSEDMTTSGVLASIGSNAINIKSQTQSAIYYPGPGWLGSLSTINNTSFYKIDMENSATWEYTGIPVDPAATTYDLISGWNWISFAPQFLENINYALSAIGDAGTNIKSQTQSAMYYTNVGWLGSLTILEPLAGYMLKTNAALQFNYPEPPVRSVINDLANRQSSTTSNMMDVDPYLYEFNGSMVISSDDDIPDNSRIVAVCEGNIRSICELLDYTEILGRRFYSLMVYSNDTYEENFLLYYQGSEDCELTPLDHTFTFQADMTTGDYISPILIELVANEGDDLPAQSDLLSVYPNPFNPETTINFELVEPEKVLLEVYNIKGQKIETLLNTFLPAGKHSINWNAGNQSTGIYFLHYQTNSSHEIRKLILLK